MKSSRFLVSSCLLGLGAALAYSLAMRVEEPGSVGLSAIEATERVETDTASPEPTAMHGSGESPSATQTPTASIEELIADTRSDDQHRRSAAIIALANAPKAQALPALQRAVDVSSVEGDRHLALRSLYTLAIEQGDDDARIRDTLRATIYHSDDEGVSQSAQAFLEDLDVVLAAPAR